MQPTQSLLLTIIILRGRKAAEVSIQSSNNADRIAKMAASSASSSPGNSRHGDSLHAGGPDHQSEKHGHDGSSAAPVPAEVLVEYLLAAKRALSSMTLVLRANDLTTHARQLHEESVILRAQTTFLNKGITEQRRLLNKVRRSMIRTYDAGKKEFKHIIKTLDVANGKLEATMDMLRKTTVDPVFRPAGEEPKNLLDFVDENQVHGMREALKASIAQLQVWPLPNMADSQGYSSFQNSHT